MLKSGDLAIVVSEYNLINSKNIGKICTVVEYIPEGSIIPQYCLPYKLQGKELTTKTAIWTVDVDMVMYNVSGQEIGYARMIAASSLKPLRDSDEEDETFQWAGKPTIVSE